MTKRNNHLSDTLTTMGASNLSTYKRVESDYYATDPIAVEMLDKYGFLDKDKKYWECACGNGNLSLKLIEMGYDVYSSDLYDRGYGVSGVDFLKVTDVFDGNIITNPPFSDVNDFIVKGLELTDDKLYIFGKIQIIETIKRWKRIFSRNRPTWILPFVERIKCYPNNQPTKYRSAMCYAWFIWDNQDDSGETRVDWLI